MAKILGNFHLALLIGVRPAARRRCSAFTAARWTHDYWVQFLRYLHVFAGILWIGLLYYFNFVQIPTMPKVPAELKPGVTKYIAPGRALLVPLGGAGDRGARPAPRRDPPARLRRPRARARGRLSHDRHRHVARHRSWRANVWLVIWPNQKRALGIVAVDDASKAKSASAGDDGLADQPHPVAADALLHDHGRRTSAEAPTAGRDNLRQSLRASNILARHGSTD